MRTGLLILIGVTWFGVLMPRAVAVDAGGLGELSGSYRNLLFAGDSRAGNFVEADLNRLRLEWTKVAGPMSMHIAYDNEFFGGGLVSTPEFRAAASQPEPTFADAEAVILQRGRTFWRHRLYRAWINYDSQHLQVKIGRQRVAWGTGRVWNPTDRFNPVDPTALEPEEKTGVDGLFSEFRYSNSGALQIVAAPGRGARNVSRKLAFRLRDTLGETDFSILAGRIGDEDVFGGDVAANLWGGGLHGEILNARRSNGVPYTQASAGYEYTLTTPWLSSGLYLLAEYFFNGAAERMDIMPVSDRLFSHVRHQLGLSAGYDLTPLWRLEGVIIADAVKGSAFVSPRLTWSVMENVELNWFVLLFGGHAGSEFGDRANIYSMQLEAYF